MKKIVCPHCDEELEFINKKFACPCCEAEWNKLLLECTDYYNPQSVEKTNTIIAFEYKLIKDLLDNGQIYGLIFQIKDLYELVIRIPVLLVCAIVYRRDLCVKSRELLFYLMSKPLSLGDWRHLLNLCHDVLEEDDGIPKTVSDLVEATRKLVNSDKTGDIVYWRNNTIAHGATKLIDDQDLYNDMGNKLRELTQFLTDNIKLFESHKFVCENGVELIGSECDFQDAKGQLLLEIEGNRYPLMPFFDLKNEGIFLFDRYIFKQQKTDIIEYIKSVKKTVHIAELNALYLENSISTSNQSTSLESYSIEERNMCDDFLASGEFLQPDFLVDWLNERLSSSKDVFMLQMEKGMGKSFFIRGLDPYSVDKISLDNVSVKTFYVNSTYNSRIDDFSVYVEDELRKISRGNTLANNTFRLDINTDNPSLEFASFLNNYKEKYYNDRKLLFVFDGIDELKKQRGKNIIDFIPSPSQLVDGVYVLVTCRTTKPNDGVASFIKHYIDNFQGNRFVVNQSDAQYLAFIKKYYDLHIVKKIILLCKRNGASFSVDYDQTDKIFEQIEDKSILGMTLIKELLQINVQHLIKAGKTVVSPQDLTLNYDMYEAYFNNIKEYYGLKYYRHFIEVLCCLSLADRPLSLHELSILSGCDNLNFAFLGFINSMKMFLSSERSNDGTVFQISHLELKNVIKTVFNKQFSDVCNRLISKIQMLSNNNFDFNSINDTVYYSCFHSLYEMVKQDCPEKESVLLNALLAIPVSPDWSQNYFEVISELSIAKNAELLLDKCSALSTRQQLALANFLINVGLDELIINRYAQSEYYFIKALQYFDEKYAECTDDELYLYAEGLSYYATLKWRLGENVHAMNLYKKVIEIKEKKYSVQDGEVRDVHLLSEYICYANIANSAKHFNEQKRFLALVENELPRCEESDFKKRTVPFFKMCCFYYYRDNGMLAEAGEAIKQTVESYWSCVEQGVGFYLPDLVKAINFRLNTLKAAQNVSAQDLTAEIRLAESRINYIHDNKDYNDDETYLEFLLIVADLYGNVDAQISRKYYEQAYDYFTKLSDKQRENETLIKLLNKYSIKADCKHD